LIEGVEVIDARERFDGTQRRDADVTATRRYTD